MSSPDPGTSVTYALGAVCKLTGLSPDVIRAWEKRHEAVKPQRTPGGTRRYSESDVKRLGLLAAATRAGHSIGGLARLSNEQLAELAAPPDMPAVSELSGAIEALDRFDLEAIESIASRQLLSLGPARFAREFALPLAQRVGNLWEQARLGVAAEHLGSAVLRSLLGASLRTTPSSRRGPVVLFCTPPGELHEFGLITAALTCQGSGCNALYFGTQLPAGEVAIAVERTRAAAVSASLVSIAPGDAGAWLRELRELLAASTPIWIGGRRAAEIEVPPGVSLVSSFDDLEERSALLAAG